MHGTHGQQDIDAVVQTLSPARTALEERLRLLIADRKFCAIHLRTLARDDIDDGKHGILAVYRATRSGNEFDALDQVHVDWELPTGRSRVKDWVIDPITVDRNQHPGVVVARQAKAPHAKIGELP